MSRWRTLKRGRPSISIVFEAAGGGEGEIRSRYSAMEWRDNAAAGINTLKVQCFPTLRGLFFPASSKTTRTSRCSAFGRLAVDASLGLVSSLLRDLEAEVECTDRQRREGTGPIRRRTSLLSARSYIFTFQRRCATSRGASAPRGWPVFYGSGASAGSRSRVSRSTQLLQGGTVLAWIRVFAVRVG